MWARKSGSLPMIRIGSATRTHQKVKYRDDCNNNASLTSYLAGFSSNFPVEVDRGIERDLWPSPFVPLSKERARQRESNRNKEKESSSSVFTFAQSQFKMGGILGKTMETNFQKQQDFMLEMNRITLERQIQMQNQMRERMAAAQIARARELLLWLGSFYTLASVGMISG